MPTICQDYSHMTEIESGGYIFEWLNQICLRLLSVVTLVYFGLFVPLGLSGLGKVVT